MSMGFISSRPTVPRKVNQQNNFRPKSLVQVRRQIADAEACHGLDVSCAFVGAGGERHGKTFVTLTAAAFRQAQVPRPSGVAKFRMVWELGGWVWGLDRTWGPLKALRVYCCAAPSLL